MFSTFEILFVVYSKNIILFLVVVCVVVFFYWQFIQRFFLAIPPTFLRKSVSIYFLLLLLLKKKKKTLRHAFALMSHLSTDCVNILYHSAFYTFFLDAAFCNVREVPAVRGGSDSAFHGEKGRRTSWPGKGEHYFLALRVLASIGCESAMEVVHRMNEEDDAVEKSTDNVVSDFVSASTSLLTIGQEKKLCPTTESECYASAEWMHQFQLAAVAHLDLHRVPTTHSSETSTAERTETTTPTREALLLHVLQSVPHRKEKDGAIFRHTILEYVAAPLRYALEKKHQYEEEYRRDGPLQGRAEVTDLPSSLPPVSALPLLFAWHQPPPVPTTASFVHSPTHPSDRKRCREEEEAQEACAARAREASLEVAWREGQLFGALAFLEGCTVTSVFAKLLVLYLYAPRSSKGSVHSEDENHRQAEEEEEEWYGVRASGVVAGIIDMALEVARSAVPRALTALHRLQAHEEKDFSLRSASSASTPPQAVKQGSREKKEREDTGGDDDVEKVTAWRGTLPSSAYPLPEESVMVLVNTGLLLARLVEYSSLYEEEKRCEEAANVPTTPGASPTTAPSRVAFSATTLAEVVAHHLQLLLLTLLTGCGTTHVEQHIPVAPSRAHVAMRSTTARLPSSTSSSTSSSSAVHVGPYGQLAIVVQRGLHLSESDALLTHIFPSFLQAVGYEWCWSETIRYFRRIEKTTMTQMIHAIQPCLALCSPPHSSSLRTASSLVEKENITMDVALRSPVLFALQMGQWSSKAVMDAILIAIARRTYPSRLYQLLPGSYHPLLDGLGILPAVGAAEVMAAVEEAEEGEKEGAAGSSVSNPLVPPTLFVLPPYYEDVARHVMQYWDRVGTIAAIQLEELEHILQHQTAVLPMMVRIRAMAPTPSAKARMTRHRLPSGGNTRSVDGVEETQDTPQSTPADESDEEEALLTGSTVEALLARYQAEVLLVAVVVYTQLTVPSQSQALLRTLAPLLERYLLLYTRSLGHVGSAVFPLWIHASATGGQFTSTAASSSSSSSSFALPPTVSWRFSPTVQRVCGEAGYQLYPLEWLPSVGEMYLHHRRQKEVRATPTDGPSTWRREEPVVGVTLSSSSSSSSSLPYYSLFAAVAHQLHLSFRTPLGSSGGSATRCVTSVLAMVSSSSSSSGGGGGSASHSIVMPPLVRSHQERDVYAFPLNAPSRPNHREGEREEAVGYQRGRQRVERFTQLMQWVYLDMRDDVVSSVEMTATRSTRGGADGGGDRPSHREEAFFHTFIEAKDFWHVACQGFLPCVHWYAGGEAKAKEASEFDAALYYTPKGTPSPSSSSSFVGAISGSAWGLRRLEAAWQWCQNVFGSAADEAAAHTKCQKMQREWWNKKREEPDGSSSSSSNNSGGSRHRRTTLSNAAFDEWQRRGCFFFFDSATFDASLEARNFLRHVPLRLLEKWRWMQRVREEEEEKVKEVHGETSSLDATFVMASPSRALRECNTASFLLQMQMRQWMEMSDRCVDNDSVDPSFSFEAEGREEGEFTRDRQWGVREWWWNSPLFFDELRGN